MEISEFHGMARFGLGVSPQDAAALKGDVRAWLMAQINAPQTPAAITQMITDAPAYGVMADFIQSRRSKKTETKMAERKELNKEVKDGYMRECQLRFNAQLQSKQPLVERLVMFWSNHFTVSTAKQSVTGLVNHFEATAIRPHVLGKFSDMLLASSRHPAMQMYLDNHKSIGPNSKQGTKREKSYNENLAREILELHTLGVKGGYTQNDVIALAMIITGWSVNVKEKAPPVFEFNPRTHEPGSKTLLGKTYAEAGEAEGRDALLALAQHPSTATHIATKLARHFIADEPPQAVITRLAEVFKSTGGDLKAVTVALINSEEAWTSTLNKFKTPYEFVLSAMRLMGRTEAPDKIANTMEVLNFKVFGAPSPAGYPDVASAWAGSDNVKKQIEWTRQLASKSKVNQNPAQLAENLLGPVMREETRKVISGAETPQDGLAFLLTSPEFMRR